MCHDALSHDRRPEVPSEDHHSRNGGARPFAPGAYIRFLADGPHGNLIHSTVPPAMVGRACRFRTVDEYWFVLSGEGAIWRRAADGHESITALIPGVCVDIPLGTTFQYRCTGDVPLSFTCTPAAVAGRRRGAGRGRAVDAVGRRGAAGRLLTPWWISTPSATWFSTGRPRPLEGRTGRCRGDVGRLPAGPPTPGPRRLRPVRAQHDGHDLVADVDGDEPEPLARRHTPDLIAGAEDRTPAPTDTTERAPTPSKTSTGSP